LFRLALLVFVLWSLPLQAAPLKVMEVAKGVYAIIGETGQRSKENLGNNATFGAVVTSDGVVLIDPGGSAKGAARVEEAIATVTDQPVVAVINTGGQDHRWLGNGYFKAKGARIIASADAVADQKERTNDQLTGLGFLVGEEGLAGTKPVYAEETFENALELSIGGVDIEIRHPGPAHTPGDSFVWLPGTRVVFSGDIIYLDRMLGVMSYSDSRSWIASFKALAALEPQTVVPGHGAPAPLAKARAETLDYLVSLRTKVGAVIEQGGMIEEGIAVDQSLFAHLANFEILARRNAQQVFMEMEFD